MVALAKVVGIFLISSDKSCMLSLISFTVNAKPQCQTDNDCSLDKTCAQGTCIFACSLVNCGLNAICEPRNHRGTCQCIPGYFGNPDIACKKGRFSIIVSHIPYSSPLHLLCRFTHCPTNCEWLPD